MLSGTVKLLITLGSLKIPTEISISFTSGKFSTIVVRNLYAGQEATVRTAHGKTEWFQIGKGVHQGCTLSPCLFNLYAECIMRNAGLEEAQAGIKEKAEEPEIKLPTSIRSSKSKRVPEKHLLLPYQLHQRI